MLLTVAVGVLVHQAVHVVYKPSVVLDSSATPYSRGVVDMSRAVDDLVAAVVQTPRLSLPISRRQRALHILIVHGHLAVQYSVGGRQQLRRLEDHLDDVLVDKSLSCLHWVMIYVEYIQASPLPRSIIYY